MHVHETQNIIFYDPASFFFLRKIKKRKINSYDTVCEKLLLLRAAWKIYEHMKCSNAPVVELLNTTAYDSDLRYDEIYIRHSPQAPELCVCVCMYVEIFSQNKSEISKNTVHENNDANDTNWHRISWIV